MLFLLSLSVLLFYILLTCFSSYNLVRFLWYLSCDLHLQRPFKLCYYFRVSFNLKKRILYFYEMISVKLWLDMTASYHYYCLYSGPQSRSRPFDLLCVNFLEYMHNGRFKGCHGGVPRLVTGFLDYALIITQRVLIGAVGGHNFFAQNVLTLSESQFCKFIQCTFFLTVY